MLQAYKYIPQIWPSFITVIVLAVLAVYAWRRRNLPGARWFVTYCLLALFYLVFKVIGYHAVDFETKVFWFNIEYLWWLPGTTAMTYFILEYARPGRWVTPRIVALLSVVPLLGLILTFSNDFQHLLFRDFRFNGSVVPLYGPAGWVLTAYNLGLRIASASALVWLFTRSPQHRWPAVLILLAQAIVGILLVFDPLIQESWFLYIPEKAVPVAACAVALFGFRIFDPIPLARQRVVEQIQAGMLVLDLKGRVVSLNPAAERILKTPARQIKGKLIEMLLPVNPEKVLADSGETEIELGIGTGENRRDYILRAWPLNDFRGLTVGFMLLLNDVTVQKRTQAQILEQQRSLAMLHEREQIARELHDTLGQVFAFVNAQGQAIHHLLSRGDLSTADEYVCRLIDVAGEADTDIRESITGLRAMPSKDGLLPTLTQYLAHYEKNYGIQTRLEGSETFTDGEFEPQVEVQLLRILQEALTNARKHANAHSVRIAFVLEDGLARVTIHDDGRGFDPEGISTEMEGRVGLRVMRERAEDVGGSFSLNSSLGQGTELVVRVPVKERCGNPG